MAKIAVDIMGGDNAPQAIMDGVARILQNNKSGLHLFLVGIEDVVKSELERVGFADDQRITIVHAPQVVEMDEHAATAIRTKRKSSLNVVAQLVKEKKADAFFSAGNTGALVSSAILHLRQLPNVQRPAIAATMPTSDGGEFILMDAGATVDCKPVHLLHFAIMGNIYAQCLHKKEKPKVAILNVGSEDIKGNELTREAYKLLKEEKSINFIGNIEANEIFTGKADVVVTDGFTGNIVLKTSEGLPRVIFNTLKEALFSSIRTKIGALLSKPAFLQIRKKLNPDEYGGAIILGVNGVVVKGHGSSKPYAVECAIKVVQRSIELDLINKITQKIGETTPEVTND